VHRPRALSLRTAALTALGLLAAGLTTGLGAGVTASPAQAAVPADVRVGTFNIVTVSADQSSGDRRPWRERRGVVINQILGQGLDVVGLQEANQSSIYGSRLVDDRRNQYLDLRNGLRRNGGTYEVTSVYPYNCYHAWSSRNCHYRNRAASGDNRILYNTSRLTLLYKGAWTFPHQVAGKTKRTMAWAVFRVRSTGATFFFTSTHLDPYSKSVRVQQWHDLMGRIDSLKNGRPVVAVGDFNTSKYSDYAAPLISGMKSHGYGDVLDQRYRQNGGAHRRAQSTRHAWINSFNAFRRDVRGYSYWGNEDMTGNGVDWIWADNRLPVRQVEVVSYVDESTGQVQGVIPSDHQMLRATLSIS